MQDLLPCFLQHEMCIGSTGVGALCDQSIAISTCAALGALFVVQCLCIQSVTVTQLNSDAGTTSLIAASAYLLHTESYEPGIHSLLIGLVLQSTCNLFKLLGMCHST